MRRRIKEVVMEEGRGRGGGGGIGGGGGGFRILENKDDKYGDSELTSYILEKFNEFNNIDKGYEKIYDKLYIRNYIGFRTYKEMNEFINFDFRNQIKDIFPNDSLIIGHFCFIPLIFLIIFSITRICYKDSPKKNFEGNFPVVCFFRVVIIYAYLIIFLGFFSYIIYKYASTKNKRNYKNLKTIKADIFIEDFIHYFCSKKDLEEKTLLVEILLFIVSGIFFILGWIYHIYYNLYLKKAYKAKVLGLKLKFENKCK